jgi:hypothetical protein
VKPRSGTHRSGASPTRTTQYRTAPLGPACGPDYSTVTDAEKV